MGFPRLSTPLGRTACAALWNASGWEEYVQNYISWNGISSSGSKNSAESRGVAPESDCLGYESAIVSESSV